MHDAMIPMATTAASMMHCSVMVFEARSSASLWLPSLSLLATIGTNAALKAPSANNALSMLGIAKATLKAACAASVLPQYQPRTMSRAKPKTRLAMMQAVLTNTFRDSDFITKNACSFVIIGNIGKQVNSLIYCKKSESGVTLWKKPSKMLKTVMTE